MENKFQRCAPDDPNRCQCVGKNGQCPYLSVPGQTRCHRHIGSQLAIDEKKRVKQYRLQIWQERLDEFAESEQVKSLRDEIGILRLCMENLLNNCKSNMDLIMHSSKISDLAVKLEKLVCSANRLETNMGMLLDKSAALNFAGQIVNIISRHINDPGIIDEISDEIITALGSLTKENV